MSKERYLITEDSNGWRADGDGGGVLYWNYSENRAYALPSLDLCLSPLSKGERVRAGSARNADGTTAPEIYMLVALMMEDHHSLTARRYREEYMMKDYHSLSARRLREALLNSGVPEESLMDVKRFHDEVGAWFISLLKLTGSNGISALLSWVKKIEGKVRAPTAEERDLLRAIEAAATESGKIPTKKAVRENWLPGRASRDEDMFRESLRATGFTWLPTDVRGPNSLPKKGG